MTTIESNPKTEISRTESERFAEFALSLRFEDIPTDVVDKAKLHLLDVIGIALASSQFEFGKVVLDGARKMGNGDDAMAIGSGVRLPATSAALVNGVLAHSLDFDDTHIGAIYHASAPAMAAAFASGQANKSSCCEILTAFIVSLEIGCRLGSAAAGQLHERAFHPTALCGTFAAAAAAGRLSGATTQSLTWSFGLCGSMAAGILEIGESWLKRLHPGWAAHSGLSAVALGGAGFRGPATVFEGDKGFYAAHIQRIPSGSSAPTHGLGHQWQTRGIAFKPYPCCHFIHAFVDAALELRGQFSLDDIERIDCPLTAMLHKMVAEPRERCIHPPTAYAALFSVAHVVAQALVKGRVDLACFYDEPRDDPRVVEVAEKIYCCDDPASDFPVHFPGEVIVTLKNGQTFKSRQSTSLGTPDKPLSQKAIEDKFLANAARVISIEKAGLIIQIVRTFEDCSSIGEIEGLWTSDN